MLPKYWINLTFVEHFTQQQQNAHFLQVHREHLQDRILGDKTTLNKILKDSSHTKYLTTMELN